jgi:hypothetical protein
MWYPLSIYFYYICRFWNCSECVVFFVIHFIINLFSWWVDNVKLRIVNRNWTNFGGVKLCFVCHHTKQCGLLYWYNSMICLYKKLKWILVTGVLSQLWHIYANMYCFHRVKVMVLGWSNSLMKSDYHCI